MTRSIRCEVALLLLLCAILLGWRLGALGLIDPDEPFYALTAREMRESGDYVTPHIFGQPQFEKPILFHWLSAASFSVFGENELAARIPSALFATLLVLTTYAFGRAALGQRAAFLAALMLTSMTATVAMGRVMLTDVVFAFFVCNAVFCYWLAERGGSRRTAWFVAMFLCSSLAVLTKGPLGSLIPGLAIIAARLRAGSGMPVHASTWRWGILVYGLVAVPWFAAMLWRFGWEYFDAFFIHENLERLLRAEHGHSNHWYFYPGVLIAGTIPWTPVLAALLVRPWRVGSTSSRRLLWCWIGSSLLFFTLAQSKLPSYVYFLFVPLALVMGERLASLLADGFANPTERILFLGVAALQAAALLALPHFWKHGQELRPALLMYGSLLGCALALHVRRPTIAGVAITALGVIALILVTFEGGLASLASAVSVKAAAAQALDERGAGDRIVTDSVLVRGVHYYTRQPVAVLSESESPFWSPQAVPILVGRSALASYLGDRGAVGVFNEDTWRRHYGRDEGIYASYVGRKVVVHLGHEHAVPHEGSSAEDGTSVSLDR